MFKWLGRLIRAGTVLARLGVVLVVIAQGWVLIRSRLAPLDPVLRGLAAGADRDEAVLVGVHQPSPASSLTGEVTRDDGRGQAAASVAGYAWPARLAAWLALVLLLPLALAPWLLRALACRSNAVNLGLLLGLAAAGAAAAYAMMGFGLASGWAAPVLVGALIAALVYNWTVLDKMEKIM
jgi:hypothetical protein